MAELWLRRRCRSGPRLHGDGMGSISGSRLASGTQRLQERHQSRRFGGTQILAVSRHVPSTLNHLANQLIWSSPHGYIVEGRSTLPAKLVKGVTVVALLALKHERTLPLQGGPVVQELRRNRVSTPGIHHWTPGCVPGKMGEASQRDRDHQNRKHGDRPSTPTLLALAECEGEDQESAKNDYRSNEQNRSLHRGGQQRKHCIKPQEEEIRTRSRLNDRGIRPPAWAEWSEVNGAASYRQQDQRTKTKILPNCTRDEGDTLLLRELMVFLNVCRLANHATRHRPIVDAQLYDHQKMNRNESNQQSGNDKYVHREESRQGRSRDDRAAQHNVDDGGAHHRHAACDRCANPQTPIRILVES